MRSEGTGLRRAALLAPLLIAAPAWADEEATALDSANIESIVVTARHREEKAIDVPISITTLSAADLELKGDKTLLNLAEEVPDMTVNSPNARQTSIAIRGVGKNTANDGSEGSVGVIVDNVFLGHVGMTWLNYQDIDHVEVLRGPQGTLLGKNTTLGVLNIATKLPSFEAGGEASVSYGDYNSFVFNGAVTGPLIEDKLAARVSVYRDRADGFLTNLAAPSDSWNGSDRWGGRLQLLAQPDGDVTVRLIVEQTYANEKINVNPYYADLTHYANGQAVVAANSYTGRLAARFDTGVQSDPFAYQIDGTPGSGILTRQLGVSGQVDWDLGSHVLTSISAYRKLHFDAQNLQQNTLDVTLEPSGTLLDDEQYTEEVRFASKDGGRLDYQAGIFTLWEDLSSTSRTVYGPNGYEFYESTLGADTAASLNNVSNYITGRLDTGSVGLFGQGTWHLDDQFAVTLGVRDTIENKLATIRQAVSGPTVAGANLALRTKVTGTPYSTRGTSDSQTVSWLFSPNYKLTDDVNLYSSLSNGTKSGAYNLTAKYGTPFYAAPERTWDAELGVKSDLFDHLVQWDANLFWQEIYDYQATLVGIPPGGTTQSSYLANVRQIRMRGIETQIHSRITRSLGADLGFTYNNASYVSFGNSPCPAEVSNVQTVCSLTGRQLSGAPRFIGNVGLHYSQPVWADYEAFAYVDDVLRSTAYMDTTLSIYGRQSGYSITNFGLGVRTPERAGSLEFWVRNATDTHYITNATNASISATSPSPFTATLGQPRTLGATATLKF